MAGRVDVSGMLGWDPKTQGWLPERPVYSPVAGRVDVSGMLGWDPKTQGWLPERPDYSRGGE